MLKKERLLIAKLLVFIPIMLVILSLIAKEFKHWLWRNAYDGFSSSLIGGFFYYDFEDKVAAIICLIWVWHLVKFVYRIVEDGKEFFIQKD